MINFDFKDTDRRVRRYIVPTRIVKTEGEITNAECLLNYRDRQIQLQEREVMSMKGASSVLLDFGSELHGGAQISVYKVKGAESARLHLRFGESVSEALAPLGFKGACNDHSARDFTVDVQAYSANEYALTGYRFLYIALESDCEVLIKTVQGIFIYQPYEYIGSFECSDERLNKIYGVSAYTCHLCMQNQLWDGIKRDRLVWIGDMSPELKTIKYVFGDVPEIMNGLRLAAEDAALPRWVNSMPTYSLWWLINLEEWCHYTGNYSHLENMRDYTLGLTRQIIENVDEEGVFTPGHFIDWPTKVADERFDASRALVIMCMDACIRMCEHLGESALADECREVRARSSKKPAECGQYKQLAALMKLTGIGNKNCDTVLKTGGANGFSTFMSYYILTAMTKVCDADDIFTALKDYYGGMLDLGATTFWEDFDLKWADNAYRIDELPVDGKSDVHGDNGNYCYLGYRHSLCHGWASGPVPFLTEYVLGVNIVGDGCKQIKVAPNLGSLTFARGSIATPYGPVTIEHKKMQNGTIQTKIDSPEEIEII